KEVTESEAALLFKEWVDVAVKERATDIHVQVINNLAEVKVRIDGDLELLPDRHGGVYTPIQAERAVAWAYNNASGKGSNSNSQFSSKESLYCMIAPRDVRGKRVALRFQSVRGWAGVKVVCRLLYVDLDAPTLSYEQLGYAPSHIDQLVDASNTPSGMILFAGVTGSGKTTTLKTFVETHPENGSDAFYSIEDPVEYPLRGVHQIPVQRDLIDREGSAAKYSEVVSALMRADPGCVLMGEIRDEATAKSAQQIVETGHMACGTVHAHLVSGIVPRLTNEEIGMSRDVLTNPNILTLLAYQALVPLLCKHCSLGVSDLSEEEPETRRAKSICKKIESRFGLSTESLRFKNTRGCEHCKGRGTKGLTVVAEILTPDRQWLELIRRGEDYKAVMHYRGKSDRRFDTPDMTGKTVFEHALYKAYAGQIDVRNCERFDSFDRFEVLEESGAGDQGGREQ
ncbi:MAG: ATPase, T2SS/T4P/T4SS family, partial [Limnobacter sp.]|nr:ATPase, T2SS/T4P/T4SS family [Limnobacter sp.]